MTLAELLALLGRSWSRLLLYPGGLGLLLAVALAMGRHSDTATQRHGDGSQLSKGWNTVSLIRNLFTAIVFLRKGLADSLLVLAAPWLAVALLPLPGAVDLGKGLDVVVALALLDVPLFAALWAELRGAALDRERGARRLVAALNLYPPLLLALLLLAAAAGSLELGQLASAPPAPELVAAHWLGATALLLTLPSVLGLDLFAAPPVPIERSLAMHIRAVGYCLLALLPLLAPLDGLWKLAPPFGVAFALWLFDRTTRRWHPRAFANIFFALALLLLGALLALAAWQLRQRLR